MHSQPLFAQTEAAAQGFLYGLAKGDARQDGFVLLTGRYQPDGFRPDLFGQLGQACPDTLQSASPRRLAEFLAGRALARVGLQMLGQGAGDLAIGADRRPVWPLGITGSISHARSYVACLVGGGASPGIDVEVVAQGRALAAIFRIALCDDERRRIMALPAPMAALVATMVFSAKEALFKALYPSVRRHFGLHSAELVGLPGDATLTLRLTVALTADLPVGAEFTLHWMAGADHVLTWMVHHSDAASLVP